MARSGDQILLEYRAVWPRPGWGLAIPSVRRLPDARQQEYQAQRPTPGSTAGGARSAILINPNKSTFNGSLQMRGCKWIVVAALTVF